jgi:predicted AAA+ superfamily ATPase
MRNALYYHTGFDITKLLENYVYNMLIKNGYQVRVGTVRGTEIDFVAQKEEKKLYIQVSYLMNSVNTYEREFGNLLLIDDNFEKMVVSLDDVEFKHEKGIKHVKMFDFESIL